MFGFLRPRRGGLEAQQRAEYAAHVCAGCHAMRDFGGRPASLLAGYDLTFLLLVLSALDEPGAPVTVDRRPCTALPFRKVAVQRLSPRARRAAAAVNMALVRAKVRDDAQDEGRLRDRILLRLLGGPGKRAEQTLAGEGFPVEVLEAMRRGQERAERASRPSLEELCAPTEDLMEAVLGWLSPLTRRPECAGALRRGGRALGTSLYLSDALADREEDHRAGRFNALEACGLEPRDAVPRLAAAIDALEAAFRELPLGDRLPLVLHVVDSLRLRVPRIPDGSPRVACDDCGLSCCCAAGDTCSGAECCCASQSCTDCFSSCMCCPDCCWCAHTAGPSEGVSRDPTPRPKQGTCSRCGGRIPEGTAFCLECGRSRG